MTPKRTDEELQAGRRVKCRKCSASPGRRCHNGFGVAMAHGFMHAIRIVDGLRAKK